MRSPSPQPSRLRRPRCRIVWGGWHPSLFPARRCARRASTRWSSGRASDTFAEIVERRSPARRAAAARWRSSRRADRRDINDFPEHDYWLIDVERYFALKGERQLDYITSQGCRFRCTFCADPTVYGRGWFGLEPMRVGDRAGAALDAAPVHRRRIPGRNLLHARRSRGVDRRRDPPPRSRSSPGWRRCAPIRARGWTTAC